MNFEFNNMPESKSIRRCIENEIANLEYKFEGIKNCQISVDLPYHHRYPGNIYNFKIEITTPDEIIMASRKPSAVADESNIHSLIHEIFEELESKLKKCACEKLNSENANGSVKKDVETQNSNISAQILKEHLYERTPKNIPKRSPKTLPKLPNPKRESRP